MRTSIKKVLFFRYSGELLPADGASGGAYGNWNGISRSGNLLTSISSVTNGFSYIANIKAGSRYRVRSPLPAAPITGGWAIQVSWSPNGSTLGGIVSVFPIDALEFYFVAPPTSTSVEVSIFRGTGGTTDTCNFYGFSMVEVY